MDHEQSPELIEQQMHATRDSLTEKVAALEQQVLGTLQNASSVVSDTVENVRAVVSDSRNTIHDTVHDSLASVKEAVKDSLDVRDKVRENPWASVGIAAAAGFLTGLAVFRSASRAAAPAVHYMAAQPATAAASAPAAPGIMSGLLDELLARVAGEARKLADVAIKSASESLNQTVNDGIPKLFEKVAGLADVTAEPVRRDEPANRVAGYPDLQRH